MAGNITNVIETWRTNTPDSNILDMVMGCHLEFDAEPAQRYVPKHLINYTHREKGIIEVEITKLQQKGVIKKAISCPGQFISSVFIRPKKDGSFQMILNLKQLNAITILKWRHTFQSALTLVKPGSYMAFLVKILHTPLTIIGVLYS